MADEQRSEPVAPGEPAPDFDLPMVSREGRVRLDDYRGRSPLLLGMFRRFECPFCRRLLASMKQTADELAPLGIETLAVTGSPVRAARLYVKYRPPGLALASDPMFAIHRRFGTPVCAMTTDEPTDWPRKLNINDAMKLVINPGDELPEAMPAPMAGDALDALDGFEAVETDEPKAPPGNMALVGYFLIDRSGIVRWRYIEALDDPASYGQKPGAAEMMAAARAVA
jgi:peroxiredoxin